MIYLIIFTGVIVLMGVAYVLFMKKYYHLHDEYLKGKVKNGYTTD